MLLKWITAKEIIQKMKEGWELNWDTHFDSRGAWLQRDRLGKGGDIIAVHTSTFRALVRKGLIIRVDNGFPTCKYDLREKL